MPPTRPDSPRSVLIADPCPDNAGSPAGVLRLSGHRAIIAQTAADAFTPAVTDPPDVLITNAVFQDGDGSAQAVLLFQALRAGTLIIHLTAHPGPEERARSAGFDRYFAKPADLADPTGAVEGPRPTGFGGAVCTSS